jgi:mevalonate kinase
MKLSKSIAALAIAGALSIGTASAMGLSSGTQPLDSIVGVSSASISVNLTDGVATLFGNVESGAESALAANHVEKIEGVDRVINLITHN